MAATRMETAPGQTLSLAFKKSKVPGHSLRLLPKDSWAAALGNIGLAVGAAVDSTPVEPPGVAGSKKDGKRHRYATKGTTGYLMGNASLFVSDTAITLQSSGDTSVLGAFEPLMELMLPGWSAKCPDQYLKYATYSHIALAEEQEQSKLLWDEEVAKLRRHFVGDCVALGSDSKTMQRLFVANYASKDEILDLFSTQVVAADLEAAEQFYLSPEASSVPPGPLRAGWRALHGSEPRCPTSRAQLSEEYSGTYAGNAVFGNHFTCCHSSATSGVPSKVAMSSSMPLTREARQRFVAGLESLCTANTVSVAEFSLSSMLFQASEPPTLQGLKLVQTCRHVGASFACALHHYARERPAAKFCAGPRTATSIASSLASRPRLQDAALERLIASVRVADASCGAAAGAQLYLRDNSSSDLPVALLDVGALKRRADLWAEQLPRVAPFYAVKCNSNAQIASTLWSYWGERRAAGLIGQHGGFDCASPSEMDVVKSLPQMDMTENIVYANPCKHGSAVEFAKSVGVSRIVFDNAQELDKMKRLYPEAQLVLRVQTDDSLAQCPLSNKFGAPVAECGALLDRALELNLTVVGVSFHVGSGCSQVGAFRSALRRARAVFDAAEERGLELELLDIGGGFPGWDEPGEATFADHAADIREMLDELFPSQSLRIIAEPGRFFAATAQSVLATVISVAASPQGMRYYLNDGVYGSFNCLIYDHASVPQPQILRAGAVVPAEVLGPVARCTVFGPTCDGFDTISEKLELPSLRCGDKLLFENMGAYTSSASTSFNGFAPAACFAFESELR